MPSIEEGAKKEDFTFLFKGEPSSGKSIAAASFPNPYIFDTDGRIRSVANYYLPKGKRDITYDTFNYSDYAKFDKKWEELIELGKMTHKPFPYDTIIIDTLTSVADILLHHVREVKGKDNKGKKIAGVSVNSVEDYNVENSALTELVLFLRSIKCKYKILIAHVVATSKTNINDDTTIITRRLLTAGKPIAAKLPGYFDEIYQFESTMKNGQQQFIARTVNAGEDYARSAMNLPKEINFTNKNFFDIIRPNVEEVLTYGNKVE
jgi:hypothetical protein